MDISDVIRSRRAALGLSQAELAKAAGVSLRQLARYEAGEQQPVLSAAVSLADALDISLGELAGVPAYGVKLTGQWWSAWQSFKDGNELVATQPVQMRQEGERIQIEALDRGRDVEDRRLPVARRTPSVG